MNCPKCHGALHEMEIEGVKVDFCSPCKGIWFDKDEMAFMAELPEDLPEVDVQQAAVATDFDCPRCNNVKLQTMKFVKAEDLLIDRCPACQGIWLDKGELPKVEKIAAHIGDAKSKILFVSKQLRKKGYQILGMQS